MSKPAVFKGFADGEILQVGFPDAFFRDLLPLIDDLLELKITMYIFWFLSQLEDKSGYIRLVDFAEDEALMQMLDSPTNVTEVLNKAVKRGTLLKVDITQSPAAGIYYFLNSPHGRAAVEEIRHGRFRFNGSSRKGISLGKKKPNIFKLYEENIGAITPMMAEILKEDEERYPSLWIVEAIQIAVQRNARNWKYVQAILESWQKEGRDGKDRQNAKRDGTTYRESWLGKEN